MTAGAPGPSSGVKLIASDLDGTILGHDFTISPRVVEAFGSARAAGYEVVFVTGRPPWFMKPLLEHMGSAGHTVGRVIGCNGAVVCDLESGEILESELLSIEDALATIEGVKARVPHAAFAAETLDGPIAEPRFLLQERISMNLVDDLAEALRARSGELDGVLKLHARDPESSDADGFFAVASEGVAPGGYPTHSVVGYALMEVSKAGVNKAVTLARYAAELNIAPHEVMAFGDMPNDRQMLEWAGFGFAMASGHPAAQEAADRVAPAFEDDGVAVIIEGLLESGTVPEGITR
jgi:Cof subfamily protein (haloacid dehalogenase superfamily)